MNEIKCPHCGVTFKVDEAGFADILKQVRDKEFEQEIHDRVALLERDKENAIKPAGANAKNILQTDVAKKEAEIAELKADKNSLIAKLEAEKTAEITRLQSEKATEIARLQSIVERRRRRRVWQRRASVYRRSFRRGNRIAMPGVLATGPLPHGARGRRPPG